MLIYMFIDSLSFIRQYKVVQYFARRPWEKDLPKWYPPTDKFSSLLFHLQHLGLYNDEHLVSND